MRLLFVAFWLMAISGMTVQAVPVENGVSWALAQYRSAHISDVNYNLLFTVPALKSQPVYFEETLLFNWTGDEDLQIDFQGDANQLSKEILVNGTRLKTVLSNEHIVIPLQYLVQGHNWVTVPS